MSTTVVTAEPAASPDAPRTRLGSALFPTAPADSSPTTRVSRRQFWLGALVVLIGTVVSLSRTVGHGPFNSIFAEDGTVFLQDAMARSVWTNLLKFHAGYLNTVPRLLAETADWVPIRWAPAVLSTEAAMLTALMGLAIWVASAGHLRHPLARLLAAAPLILAPVGETMSATTANNIATLQFLAVYASFWMILWVPASRAGRIVQTTVVVATAASTALGLLVIPLALVRWWVRRDWPAVAMSLTLVAFTVINFIANESGHSTRAYIAEPRLDPVWGLYTVVDYVVPHSIFGDRGTVPFGNSTYPKLQLLAWLMVFGVVLVALLGVTRPDWTFASLAGLHAIGAGALTAMLNGLPAMRYLLISEMLLFAAFAALLLPRPAGARPLPFPIPASAPLVGLAAVIAVSCLANYRADTGRSYTHSWSSIVAKGKRNCSAPGVLDTYVSLNPTFGSGDLTTDNVDSPQRGGWPIVVQCRRLLR